MMPEAKPELATIDEVAKYLRTTPQKLGQDRYRGVGPKFVKHGRRVLYRWADVYAWTEANTMQRTDDQPAAS